MSIGYKEQGTGYSRTSKKRGIDLGQLQQKKDSGARAKLLGAFPL